MLQSQIAWWSGRDVLLSEVVVVFYIAEKFDSNLNSGLLSVIWSLNRYINPY